MALYFDVRCKHAEKGTRNGKFYADLLLEVRGSREKSLEEAYSFFYKSFFSSQELPYSLDKAKKVIQKKREEDHKNFCSELEKNIFYEIVFNLIEKVSKDENNYLYTIRCNADAGEFSISFYDQDLRGILGINFEMPRIEEKVGFFGNVSKKIIHPRELAFEYFFNIEGEKEKILKFNEKYRQLPAIRSLEESFKGGERIIVLDSFRNKEEEKFVFMDEYLLILLPETILEKLEDNQIMEIVEDKKTFLREIEKNFFEELRGGLLSKLFSDKECAHKIIEDNPGRIVLDISGNEDFGGSSFKARFSISNFYINPYKPFSSFLNFNYKISGSCDWKERNFAIKFLREYWPSEEPST
ncbi:MAG: hypothetical protein QXW65_01950 [Candidatus Pacearchaeota archaeon]